MTYVEQYVPARERHTSPLLPTAASVTPHHIPVPLPAHPTDRAIRELRSPR
ncbi:hypothetical protein GCM10023086_36010 [Streptomyces venetus]|uniref:Uncharacterized protein n=1 Tax=Streptomyces venetus TaxID=1701086 RepID=A0ABP8G085_9ACTN